MNFYQNFIKTHPIKKIKIGNLEREYLTGGESNVAFLVFPGLGEDMLGCYDLVDAFEKRFKVIVVNYSGIYDLTSFYEYVNSILVKENISKVILYGLSLGGFLAQHYVRNNKEKVISLIISHAGSTKSKYLKAKVSIPGKFAYHILQIIPESLITPIFNFIASKAQTKDSNIKGLYEKYSTKENYERRALFINHSSTSFVNKTYLKSVYKLGTEMEKQEKNFTMNDLNDWKGNILIIKTDNDPLVQDNGILKLYYPNAKKYTFNHTGHLTPFIQFEKLRDVIVEFLNN